MYKKLLDEQTGLADIEEFDPQLFTTLTNILKADTVVGMDLTMSVSYDNYGQEVVVDLVEGGATVPVTDLNKEEFVRLYVKWYLKDSVDKQFQPFYEGFYKVVSKESIGVDRHDLAL